MIEFDVTLTRAERERIAATDAGDWFTTVRFGPDESPRHPKGAAVLDENNRRKVEIVARWFTKVCPGASVLDSFCANGAFSFLAARAGARQVVGFDFDQPRIDVANMIAGILRDHGQDQPVRFEQVDAYETARHYEGQTFDVTLALGGLYHVADPPHVLRQLRQVSGKWLIVQTTHVLPLPGNWGRFYFREDRTAEGLSSVRGGYGVWKYTVGCFRRILRHGGFLVVDEWQPPLHLRRRFPWYSALARVV